ncbi:MAG: ankyrin repeat domain-containing protein [Myxococcota bacterium]
MTIHEDLFDAVGHSDVGRVRELLAAGADPNWLSPIFGRRPLHQVAEHDRPEMVSLLLEHGADIDAEADDGLTPIAHAVDSAIDGAHQTEEPIDLAVVRAFLDAGADPVRGGSSSALQIARDYRHEAVEALHPEKGVRAVRRAAAVQQWALAYWTDELNQCEPVAAAEHLIRWAACNRRCRMLSDKHRHFLLVEQGVVPTVFNLVINGVIAWALFRTAKSVPLWGESSIGIDLMATAFLLPFLTCVIVSKLVARQVHSGKLPPLPAAHLPLSKWFRRPTSVRGLFLGVASMVFAAAPIIWALDLGMAQPFSVPSFIAFKAIWAALLALAVTPFVGWWALAHASRENPA